MKVIVAFVVFCLVGIVVGEAPYPASGYRPTGPRFDLPQNQFGAPALPASNSLPVLPATNFNGNGVANQPQNNQNGFGQDSNGNNNQNGFLNQDSFAKNNQQYGAPFTPNTQANTFDQSLGTNFNLNNGNRFAPPGRQDFGDSSQFGVNTQYGAPGKQAQNGQGTRFNVNQQYPQARPEDASNNQGFNNNPKAYQPQAPIDRNQGNDFSRDGDEEDTVGVNNQNYIPPSTTESATKADDIPNDDEPIDSQEDSEDPNVAISTALAKGRYYLLPNGNSQRLVYPKSQFERLVRPKSQVQSFSKNNRLSARLVYENVNPISSQFYSYSNPAIIRIY
ncbi:hypothetical protein RN001_014352 [Aquatica leii]|uniref:Uncharacterized protein n=1 Tax=Aquatica leii TaxID=1421715 RepID=A0AAN7SKH0_9COLE|nr:hypothetical protein RN001_014352 [Aquatica leii]